VGAENRVLVIDLAREMPRNSVYYYDYLHYTEAGAAKVADIIYRDLRPFLARCFWGAAAAGLDACHNFKPTLQSYRNCYS